MLSKRFSTHPGAVKPTLANILGIFTLFITITAFAAKREIPTKEEVGRAAIAVIELMRDDGGQVPTELDVEINRRLRERLTTIEKYRADWSPEQLQNVVFPALIDLADNFPRVRPEAVVLLHRLGGPTGFIEGSIVDIVKKSLEPETTSSGSLARMLKHLTRYPKLVSQSLLNELALLANLKSWSEGFQARSNLLKVLKSIQFHVQKNKTSQQPETLETLSYAWMGLLSNIEHALIFGKFRSRLLRKQTESLYVQALSHEKKFLNLLRSTPEAQGTEILSKYVQERKAEDPTEIAFEWARNEVIEAATKAQSFDVLLNCLNTFGLDTKKYRPFIYKP